VTQFLCKLQEIDDVRTECWDLCAGVRLARVTRAEPVRMRPDMGEKLWTAISRLNP
jgi:hypothetical protein